MLEWHKQEGDAIAADETLVEVSTDKVDAEVPSPVAGTIVKIHAAEGDTVAVGALLAEIAAIGPTANRGASAAANLRWRSTPTRHRYPGMRQRRAAHADGRRPGRAPPGYRRDRRHRHADRRRVRHRGHDPRVGREGRRRGQGRRHGRRDLDRQGRHGAARSGRRHDHRDPRRGGRDGRRRPGDRADAARRRSRSRAAAARIRPPRLPPSAPAARAGPAAHATDGKAPTPPGRRRVAAAEGVDLGGVHGQRPAAGGSRRPTSSPPPTAHRPAPLRPAAPPPAPGRPPGRAQLPRAVRRRSRATWTRACARSRPRPRSARSPSRRWTPGASS